MAALDQVLLTAGIVCVIAAIAGGSFKAFGVEIPALTSVRRQFMLGFVGAALLAALAFIHRPKPDKTVTVTPPAAQKGPAETRLTPTAEPKPAVWSPGTSATMRQVQLMLVEVGLDPGPADGSDGVKTRNAIAAFQRNEGLPVDGLPGPMTVAKLQDRANAHR